MPRGMFRGLWCAAAMVTCVTTAHAQLLTADRAVEIALQNSSQLIGAKASVLDAKSGVYSGYSGVLPHLNASVTRFNTRTDNQVGPRNLGGGLTQTLSSDFEAHGTTPTVSGQWNVLNLSSITGLMSARQSLKTANLLHSSVRQDVVLATRRQFYEVVRAVQLAGVSGEALKLARDDARRVNALFQVGSVSKSDLLRAQTRSAQAELDSIVASHAVVTQRISLAELIGLAEAQMGEVDTVLTVEPRTYDEPALLVEAAKNRPDLQAAETEIKAAKSEKSSARFSRFPFLSVGGSVDLNTSVHQTSTIDPPGIPGLISPGVQGGGSTTDRVASGQIALNWEFFDGTQADARSAAANARFLRAQDNLTVLKRNLESEVRQAVLTYNEVTEGLRVAESALASATEQAKLVQQKYNVGSATILDLIDAQVQLVRAKSDRVSALAAIRVAEANIERVRGAAQ